MKLIVKNFGPIKDVEIEYNQLLLLIGPQASGKSVLAKLISIFSDFEFILDKNLNKLLSIYNIEFLTKDSYIKYEYFNSYIEYSNGEIKTDIKFSDSLNYESILNSAVEKALSEISPLNYDRALLSKQVKKQTEALIKKDYVIYIPTERTLVASISDFLFNFIKSDIKIPECAINFGARFEYARKEIGNYVVPFLENIEYVFENNTNQLKINDNKKINFSQSSSGLQAVIPMTIVIESLKNIEKTNNIIIEEPELNLYPSTQKRLVQYLSKNCLAENKGLIITTHSPYILTSFANLIQADNTAKAKPECKDEIASIIPEDAWIDFENVSAYYISEGTAKNILDYENRTIDATAIDDVSETIAKEFDALLDIKYRD